MKSRPKNDFSAVSRESQPFRKVPYSIVPYWLVFVLEVQHSVKRDVAAADQTLGEYILALRGPRPRVRQRGGVVEPRLHRGRRARDLRHRQRQRTFNAG